MLLCMDLIQITRAEQYQKRWQKTKSQRWGVSDVSV